jgi:hypothetical protein
MRTHALTAVVAWTLLVVSCDSKDSVGPEDPAEDGAVAADASEAVEVDAAESGEGDSDAEAATSPDASSPGTYVMHTEEFKVEPGQERYLCFTTTLEEELVVGGYSSGAQPFVHHLVFVRTLKPEPEGFSECDTLFRQSWDPLYITGAGAAKLDFPDGAGHKLAKGTQLLVQMHLLNSGDEVVESRVAIDMHRSAAADPRPVSTYVFGTSDLSLPPNQASEVQGMCELKEPVKLIAGFPHMHLLGKRLRFEVGSSADAMKTVFVRDPYDFDDQHIENVEIELEPGDLTRVTCGYQNPGPEEVTFGESTNNEMCFFIGFALDQDSLTSCTQRRDMMR